MHRRVVSIVALLAALVLMTACGPIVRVSTGTGPFVTGSANRVEKSFDLTGFTSVQVSAGATAHIARADATSVKITVNDNAVDYLRIEKQGDALVIGLKNGSFTNVTIDAEIAMPELTGVTASGGSHVTFDEFTTSQPVTFNTSGGAEVTGKINAGPVTVKASGGADLTLTGKADSLALNHSGGGHVNLSGFSVGNADVNISGGSQSEINASGKVSGSVSGGGQLRLAGHAASVEVKESGGGSVVR